MRRAQGGVAVALFAIAATFAAAASGKPVPATEPPPLTNEDIVRLSAYGTSEQVILDAIRERKADFDLDPGVVAELERVGVKPRVIEAMRRRQLEAPVRPGAVPPAPAPLAVTPPPGRVDLAFDETTTKKEPPQIYALTSLPKGVPRPDDSEVGTVSDLALAILCTSGDHVPDHWDTRTPLKDGPRHELLLFRAGSKPERHKGFDVIVLGQEPVGAIPLAAGTHTLVVALAGQQTGSGAWRLLAYDTIRVEAKADAETRLVLSAGVRLSGSRMLGFKSDQVWKVRLDSPAVPAPETPPAGAP